MAKTNPTTNKDYHIFTVHGDTLMSVVSGELFVLDDLAKALMECGAESAEEAVEKIGSHFPAQSIEKAYRELNYILSRPVKDHSNDNPPRNLRALCLNITHRCNLACTYCFAEKLTEQNAASMTSEVVRQSFDFLFENSGDIKRLQVDFFGGEPLLAWDRVKEGVEYARRLEKKFDKYVLFTLTTNATLLNDEIIDFIKSNNMSLILSLDGEEKIHDFHRRYRSGKGSFNNVLNNINKVMQRLGKNDYYIRGTFTSQTLDILSILKFYKESGFYNVSLEPVSTMEKTEYSLDESCLESLQASYKEAAKWMLDKDISFFHFNLEMDNPLCLTRRITGCGAGVEYLAVDPVGDLYPCHQFIENNKFRIGNVFTGIDRPDVVNSFCKSTFYEKELCSDCWARFYCGGGCHYQQYSTTGSIHKPSNFYCKLFKGRLETALWYNMKKRQPADGSCIAKKRHNV